MISIGEQTLCILCGKMRVFSKQWKEQVNGKGSIVTHTESVCADSECQKKVDAKFSEMRERKVASEERRKSNLVARQAKSAENKAKFL